MAVDPGRKSVLGALAVLVTLIYLAVQIRQNTSAVATATYERGSLPVAEWSIFA